MPYFIVGFVVGALLAYPLIDRTDHDSAFNEGFKRARGDAKRCVLRMFSDADGYDPGAYFEITSDQAPPFYPAILWINENLDDCMEKTK